MKHNLSCYRASLALVLTVVVMVSCRPRSSAVDCNFQGWENPSIIVEANGVEVVLFDDRDRVTMDKLRDYLSEVPDRYWRHGRIVSIQEGGIRGPNADDLIRRNIEQTKQIVESLGIQIKCPNAKVTAALPPNTSLDRSAAACFASQPVRRSLNKVAPPSQL